MYRELEANAQKSAAEEPAPSGDCPCICGEPSPADDGEIPAGNRSAVDLEQYWDIHG